MYRLLRSDGRSTSRDLSLTLYSSQDAFVDDKFRSQNEQRANHDRGTSKDDHGGK